MSRLQQKWLFLLVLSVMGSCPIAHGQTDSLPILKKGKLIYQNPLSDSERLRNWVMEGPGVIHCQGGWMELYSPGKKWDHVFWCPEIFPGNFIAEWEVQNLDPREGLAIVFFAATGDKGQSIFDAGLPARDGTFKYYNRGLIHCYHISYFANNPKDPDRGDSHLRKDPGFHLLKTGMEGIAAASVGVHQVKLVKNNGHIQMWIDQRKIVDGADDGHQYGPVYQSGNIGFRQMRWSHLRYRNFKVWEIKHP